MPKLPPRPLTTVGPGFRVVSAGSFTRAREELEMGHMGIDPGIGGCATWLGENGTIDSVRLATTDQEVSRWFKEYAYRTKFACIEQQTARPTMCFDPALKKIVPRILKSTVLLFGSFRHLQAYLVANEIAFEEVPPKRWQKGLAIPERAKGEEERKWKNRLKQRAEQLFPKVPKSQRITLASADSLLIAQFCREKHPNG